jgi:hypothetical protein
VPDARAYQTGMEGGAGGHSWRDKRGVYERYHHKPALGKTKESGFYRSPMLVPRTGHDPVTSCFSDTRGNSFASRITAPGQAKPLIAHQTYKGFRDVAVIELPTNTPTMWGAA